MYTSTRTKISISASKAILEGLAPEGGLYVMKNINADFFDKSLIKDNYQQLTKKIFKVFLNDYTEEIISNIVDSCYESSFIPNMVGLKDFNNFSLLELFKGETFAFKDMALAVLPTLFQEAKKINNNKRKTIILTATSGDTGSAALSGFSKIKDTYVIVLYPKTGISEFQELQMNQFNSDKCFCFGIEGNFDDCQKIVKTLFQELKVNNSFLSSANSINIGRIIPQIVYYFYTYFNLIQNKKINFGDQINFIVPSGNFGNIYAGYIAKQMGLPVNNLIIASNSNHVLTDLFNNYNFNINRQLQKTISPSMDILISSNFERYLFNLTGSQVTVKSYMKELFDKKIIYIDELRKQNLFKAYYATEKETINALKSFYEDYNVVIDPHTAVGYHCYLQYQKESNNNFYNVILATASPYKFSDAVLKALQVDLPKSLPEKINALRAISSENYDNRIEQVLKTKVSSKSLSLEEAYEVIKKVIGDIDDQN